MGTDGCDDGMGAQSNSGVYLYMYKYIYIYVQIESGHPLNIGSNDLGNMFFLKIYQFTF